MQIKCKNCGHTEETSLELFIKIIGGILPLGGYWAWTAYLFAGTGFAMPIVVAIIGGGTAMLIFKKQIVEWIISKGYSCECCGKKEWQ